MVSASQQVGGSIGTALLSTIATSAAAHALAGSPPGPRAAAVAAVHGYAVGFGWAAAIFAVGAVVGLAVFARPRQGHRTADAPLTRGVSSPQNNHMKGVAR
jgi:hypothetical protein